MHSYSSRLFPSCFQLFTKTYIYMPMCDMHKSAIFAVFIIFAWGGAAMGADLQGDSSRKLRLFYCQGYFSAQAKLKAEDCNTLSGDDYKQSQNFCNQPNTNLQRTTRYIYTKNLHQDNDYLMAYSQGILDFKKCVADIYTSEFKACGKKCQQMVLTKKSQNPGEDLRTCMENNCKSNVCKKMVTCDDMSFLPW
jgi:hypothetical protein